MGKKSRSTPSARAAETAAIVPTSPRPQKRRRVEPRQAAADHPNWYRGATPWNDLTPTERREATEAAANSVRFWDGPHDAA